MKYDNVKHPKHYTEGRRYEPKDVIRDWQLNFNLGCVIKYIARNGRKDGNPSLQDLKKARQFLDFEIEYLEWEEKSCNYSLETLKEVLSQKEMNALLKALEEKFEDIVAIFKKEVEEFSSYTGTIIWDEEGKKDENN